MTGSRHKSRRPTCFGISNKKCTYLIPWLSIASSSSYTTFSAKMPSPNPAKATILTKVPEHKRKGKKSHRFLPLFCCFGQILPSHRPKIAKFCRSALLKPSKKPQKNNFYGSVPLVTKQMQAKAASSIAFMYFLARICLYASLRATVWRKRRF